MHICASQFSKFPGGACPRTPLEGARAGPRRDRVAITSFGVLEFHAPPVTQILDPPLNRVHFFGKAKIRRENTVKTTSEQDTGFCAECKTLRISQICSQNSATGFDNRVQNALRVQNAVSWVSKFAVGAHFRGCVWLENIASVSEYAGVVWTGARFRGCSFSRVHRLEL